jgi:hypothetical protein
MLARCRAEVGHWPPIASTRGRRWIRQLPQAEARGLHLPGSGGAFRSAAGVLSVPVLWCPHIPTRFASGGWLTLPSGADQPVNAPETPTISPALRPLPLALTSVGRAARRYLRDNALFCRKQAATERSGAIAPPACRQGSPGPTKMRSTTTGALTTRTRAALAAYTEAPCNLLGGRAPWAL